MNEQDTQPRDTVWLKLSDAAAKLNVHPTTLRRWADEGKIPYMVTPGGHRRFASSDVVHLGERRHTVRRVGPVERIWANHALKRTREAIMAQHQESWLKEQDDAARGRNRLLGQQLMAVTMKYLIAEEEDEGLLDEARNIGRQYGRSARETGLPIIDALQASMFFHDKLLAAAIELPDNVRIPPSSQLQMLNRINRVLNTAQLGVAGAYGEEDQGRAAK
ncbi:MAG: helix-turn-helix domain-containing protein [Candidatus Krumholzibacteria bacterium]|nr:helix-turn-helix domain-containing protein [Candidatus Krumholzibacteria bacterium]